MSRIRKAFARLVPWAVTVGVLGAVFWPFRDEAGRAELAHAVLSASPWTFPVILAGIASLWLAEVRALYGTFRRFGTELPFLDLAMLRGSLLLFDTLNPLVTQVALGVALHRRGVPAARTFQVLAITTFIFFLALVGLAGIGALTDPLTNASGLSGVALAGSLVVVVGYFIVLALKPRFLASRNVFKQLFELGLSGHAYALWVRFPSVIIIYVYVAAVQRCFGIHVPLTSLLIYVPAILFVVSAPVSVHGLGPTQVVQLAFFTHYLSGDPRAIEASVLAWSIGGEFGSLLAKVVIGSLCLLTPAGRSAFVAARRGPPPSMVPPAMQ